MWLIVTGGVAWSIGRSVCTILGPAKTAEPIKMSFEAWIRVGPTNRLLDGI